MSRRITQKMVGPAGKTNERAKFIELIRQGMSSSEACRVLGVNRKTGSRWRNGRVAVQPDGSVRHYAPVVDVIVPTISPRFLSEDERVRIADLQRAGMSLRMIATNLNRSPSTIGSAQSLVDTVTCPMAWLPGLVCGSGGDGCFVEA